MVQFTQLLKFNSLYYFRFLVLNIGYLSTCAESYNVPYEMIIYCDFFSFRIIPLLTVTNEYIDKQTFITLIKTEKQIVFKFCGHRLYERSN